MQVITDCKDAIFETDKYDVVLVSTTIYSMLHGGFPMKVGHRYPEVMEINDKQPYGDQRRLGSRLTVKTKDDGPIVSLLYCCQYPNSTKEFVDYEALEHCLRTANAEFKGKNVMCDILGATKFNGNGDREKCLELMRTCLCDVNLTVYDYPQYSSVEEWKRCRKYLAELKKSDREKYDRLGLSVDELAVKLYAKSASRLKPKKQRGEGGKFNLNINI